MTIKKVNVEMLFYFSVILIISIFLIPIEYHPINLIPIFRFLIIISIIIFSLILSRKFTFYNNGLIERSINNFQNFSYHFFDVIILLSIGIIFTKFSYKNYSGISKWFPFILLPVSFYSLYINRLLNNSIALVILICYSVFVCFTNIYFYSHHLSKPSYFIFLISILLIIPNLNSNKTFNWRLSLYAFLILFTSWFSLSNLTNWNAFTTMTSISPFSAYLGSTLTLSLLSILIFRLSTNKFDLSKSNSLIYPISILVFLYFAFRHDSLFMATSSGSPSYHWEYYIGVIETLREGGLLLWDTPSQYGFLNILIPTLLPIKSSWDSFYYFQSALLFLCSFSFFAYLTKNNPPLFYKFFIFLAIFFSFYFADPEFIGPYPFPSSSVVRFFCVYAYVLMVCLIPEYTLKQAISIGLLLPFFFLWSAESFIYTGSITLFILLPLLVGTLFKNRSWKFLFNYFFILFLPSLFASLIISYFYLIKVNHLPDISLFFYYALGYAQGFGYVPFQFSGPGNFLLILFISILTLFARSYRLKLTSIAPLSALCGAIWAISSYYLGRPVPQNITAMLPLLTTFSLVAISLANAKSIQIFSLPLRIAIFPLLFIVFMPLSYPKWYSVVFSSRSFSLNIHKKLRVADVEVLNFLESAYSANIIFYGDGDMAAQPYIPSNPNIPPQLFSWLPSPLQLLEEPVNTNLRDKLLKRFSCRNDVNTGYIIVSNTPNIIDRFTSIANSLKFFYQVQMIKSTPTYLFFRLSKIKSIAC